MTLPRIRMLRRKNVAIHFIALDKLNSFFLVTVDGKPL